VIEHRELNELSGRAILDGRQGGLIAIEEQRFDLSAGNAGLNGERELPVRDGTFGAGVLSAFTHELERRHVDRSWRRRERRRGRRDTR